MAGIAATLNVPGAVEALAVALAPRGPDGTVCRLAGPHGVRLEIAVRAVIPSIARVIGAASPDPEETTVAAIAVDGVASISALDAGYADRGPRGLIGGGGEPYAVVFADAEREVLALARSGDGPGLYYTVHGAGWLVASEPAALLPAGVAASPDDDVIARFIATGACDDSPATFLRGVSRVLPDEVVVLSRDAGVSISGPPEPRPAPSVAGSLADAVARGRIGVLLGPGPLGAAVLGAALSRNDRPRPLPVHTATVDDLAGGASHTPGVLVPLPYGAVRHLAHTFHLADLDLDGFLRDAGEPVPDLALVLAWAVARRATGGLDTLIDTSRGQPEPVARLRDRILARYGVALACPLRAAANDSADEDLLALLGRTLPADMARHAAQDSAQPVSAAEVVRLLRDRVAAALAVPQPWLDPATSMAALHRVVAGESAGADLLLRAFLVQRWLYTLDLAPATDQPAPDDLVLDGTAWTRWPVRTETVTPGTDLPRLAAWYVEAELRGLCAERAYRDALRGPWFVVVSAKALAVAQRRITPLWKVQPGLAARVLARLAGRRLPRLGAAWSMQVALDEAGFLRVAVAALAAGLGRQAWALRWLPERAMVYAPREDAVAPADCAVVRAPVDTDEAAGAIVSALRYVLAPELVESLAGCAIASADETGSRVHGFADGPFADAVPHAEDLLARSCVDNPAGQSAQRTPLVLVFPAPVRARRERAGRDPRELDVKASAARRSHIP